MSLRYVKGDATYPVGTGPKIIAHICNSAGAWGGGFTASISKRWVKPKLVYRAMKHRKLGSIEIIEVENNICVINMIGQVFHHKQGPPIRYNALCIALAEVANQSKLKHATVHMPRIGTGLAGGRWELVEPMIQQELVEKGIEVYVYDWK
jgi:O-acetyl-ADP-ribose deacetylase (regulator of RNase III)